MYPVSSAYKAWMATNTVAREFDVAATLSTPYGDLALTQEDIVSGSLELNEAILSGDTIEIGSVYANDLSIKLWNNRPEYNMTQMRGSRLLVEVGFKLEDNSYEWVKLGRFVVTESSLPTNTIELKCLDYMILFEKPWADVTLTFPATIEQIIDAICLKCNMSHASIATLPNLTYTVTTRPEDSALTCRDIISFCAQLSGRNARMTRDGLLEFVWYGGSRQVLPTTLDANTETLDGGTPDVYNLAIFDGGYNNQPVPAFIVSPDSRENFIIDSGQIIVTGIIYEDENEIYVVGATDYALKLELNPLVQTDITGVLNTIWTEIGYFSYIPYSATVFADPARQAGDIASFTTIDGKEYYTIVTSMSYKYRGKQTLRAVGRAAETVDYSSSTSKRLTQAIINQKKVEVNLSNYQQSMVQLGELVAQSMGVYRTSVTQPDGSTILYMHDATTLEESTFIWKQTANTFTVSDDGGVTWSGMSADGNLLVRVLTAVGIKAEWIQTGVLKDAANRINMDLTNGVLKLGYHTLDISTGPLIFTSSVETDAYDYVFKKSSGDLVDMQIQGALDTTEAFSWGVCRAEKKNDTGNEGVDFVF